MPEPLPGPVKIHSQGWLERAKRQLQPYRPRFGERRFWAVQGLVVLVAVVHTYMEFLEYAPGSIHIPVVVPISLFFIPVVYAALNFGFAGSVATALWCTILSIPNVAFFHPGIDRLSEIFQLGIVDAIAVFVGQRVDREMSARRHAEAAGAALTASEMRYRGLFESSPAAILVLDPAGKVLQANPPAGVLFERSPAGLEGVKVARLLGAEGTHRLLHSSQETDRHQAYLTLRRRSGTEVYVEPAINRISDNQGRPVIQVLLRDVTEEQHREASLRAYAAHTLRAQEEERKRIAQELHDDTIQALVMLLRRLDAVEDIARSLSSPVTQELKEARKSAEGVVQGLRDFARALRPPILEDLGLVTSVRRLVVDLAERDHVKGQLKVVGRERRLSPDTELGMFRIAQEALRNVERHSQGTRVVATMAFSERETRLDVVDNGVGFTVPTDLGNFAASGQLGLLGMQERAELLGGRLDIRSTQGKGTRVTVSVPTVEQAVSDLPGR